MIRGEIWWADLGTRVGSGPAKRRPVLVISADRFNRSRLATVVVVSISSNTGLAAMPGNVFVPRGTGGLRRDSVVNVTQLATIDRRLLDAAAGRLPTTLLEAVDAGLRLVLGV